MSKFRSRSDAGQLWLMVVIAAIVGVAASVSAVALRTGVHFLFDQLAVWRESVIGLFLPAIGALLGVWIVRQVFREPGGHGVPAVLEAVSRGGGSMRLRSMLSRLLGSLMTVAGGGSAGLEGPIVFSSAAVGSSIARGMKLAERQRVLLLACGVAGGIGAIFNAPLTGVIFAMEVVLAEWTIGALIPVVVAAAVATEAGRSVMGAEGAFQAVELSWGLPDLFACIVLGGLTGLLSVALVRSIFCFESAARRLKQGDFLGRTGMMAAAAGLLVGCIAWWQPQAAGEGYGLVNSIIDGSLQTALPLLVALLAAKFLATVLTLGSNAPGGIFAPSLVLGALLGFGFGHLLQAIMPNARLAEPGFFALVAMAGLVAGAMQAPFTGIFLALETTGGWDHSLPLMLVAVHSAMVSKSLLRHSFYTWDLAESGKLLRPGTDVRILSDLFVGEMLDEESVSIESGRTLDDLAKLLPGTHRNHFAVVAPETNQLLGMLDLSDLRAFIFDDTLRRVTPVDTVMDSELPSLFSDDTLSRATDLFEQSNSWVLPVVDKQGAYVGTVSKSTLFDRYRSELIVQTANRQE